MQLFDRLTFLGALLLVTMGSIAPTAFASTLAHDPFIQGAISRENFEPGGKYHLFGSARGTIGDRKGAIVPSPIYHQHLGNLEMEKIGLQGTIKYNANFSNHGHHVHSPFDNHDERSDSDERGSVSDGFTIYKLNWKGHEHHPADGYDGPQGSGYPAPTGARDEYTYHVSGIAERIKLNPQIATSNERSFSERLSDSWQNFGERGGAARQKITQHNPRLNNMGNALEAGNGVIEGLLYNPIGLAAEATGVSSALQASMQAAQHAAERAAIRYVAVHSTNGKFRAIDHVASGAFAVDWTAKQIDDFTHDNPNFAEGFEFATNAMIVRGGAKTTASTAQNAPKYSQKIKDFAQSEKGTLPVAKGTRSNKSDGKKSNSDNESTAKNFTKTATASMANNASKPAKQAVDFKEKSANSSIATKAVASTESANSAPNVRVQQRSSGGKFSSSLGAGGLSGSGSFTVGKFVPAGSPTAKYNRAKHYGGSQTNSNKAKQVRSEAEGKQCPSCGKIQISGTNTAPSPQHTPSLVEHYYEHGGHKMTNKERREYAKEEGISGTQCISCQRKEGAKMSKYSKGQAKKHGL